MLVLLDTAVLLRLFERLDPNYGDIQAAFKLLWTRGDEPVIAPQNAFLLRTAEVEHLPIGQAFEPRRRGRVVHVRLERQSQPDVDVSEEHRPRPLIPQRARRSVGVCPDGLRG
jgi:hypothetical protein